MQSQSNEFRPQVAERLFPSSIRQSLMSWITGKRQKKQSDGCSARISIPWTHYSRVLLSHLSPLKEGKSEAPES